VTLPLAGLVSALLVFGRLSADSELSAMKSCGVNLWRIMSTPILAGVLVSVFCLYLNNQVSPRTHEMRRHLSSSLGVGVGLKLLEPGRFIQEFPNMTFWFSRRQGDWLSEVLILDKSRAGANREIRADKARVTTRGEDIVLDLHGVRVDPFSDERPGPATADRMTHVIPGALRLRTYTRGIEDYDLGEMAGRLTDATADPSVPKAERGTMRRRMFAELNRRFALASAAFCFVLVGIPLGIRAHRRESTIGVAIGLIIAVLYYVFVIAADSVARGSGLFGLLLAWVPAVLCLTLSGVLVLRNQ
jgi:lipopolysaccharide export system permease protein